jgi:hypothetical protein
LKVRLKGRHFDTIKVIEAVLNSPTEHDFQGAFKNGRSAGKIRIYKTIIFPMVLYGCGTWSLTLREEHRLRVFENRVLRRIFGARRDEVTGE